MASITQALLNKKKGALSCVDSLSVLFEKIIVIDEMMERLCCNNGECETWQRSHKPRANALGTHPSRCGLIGPAAVRRCADGT